MGNESRTNPRSHDFGGIRPTGVKDVLGRELKLGDRVTCEKIMKDQPHPLFWEIADIQPAVDLRAAAGTMLMTLVATAHVPVVTGATILETVRVRTAEESVLLARHWWHCACWNLQMGLRFLGNATVDVGRALRALL